MKVAFPRRVRDGVSELIDFADKKSELLQTFLHACKIVPMENLDEKHEKSVKIVCTTCKNACKIMKNRVYR